MNQRGKIINGLTDVEPTTLLKPLLRIRIEVACAVQPHEIDYGYALCTTSERRQEHTIRQRDVDTHRRCSGDNLPRRLGLRFTLPELAASLHVAVGP